MAVAAPIFPCLRCFIDLYQYRGLIPQLPCRWTMTHDRLIGGIPLARP